MVQNKLPLINSAHGSETRNIINELIKLFNSMGYTYDEALTNAHNILEEAKITNDMNVNVQKQIDDLILSAGESDAEVINSRGGYPVLRDRLNAMKSQIDEKAKETELKSLQQVTSTKFSQSTFNRYGLLDSSELLFDLGFDLYRGTDGRILHNFPFHALTSGAPNVYIDRQRGLDGNDGLTKTTPVQYLKKALEIANARSESTVNIVFLEKIVYYSVLEQGVSNNNITLTKNINLLSDHAEGSYIYSGNFPDGYSWTNDNGIYKTSRTATYQVFDSKFKDFRGNPKKMVKVNSVTQCRNRLNSWYTDGTSVWVNREDGSNPSTDNAVLLILPINTTFTFNVPGVTFHIDNVHFYLKQNSGGYNGVTINGNSSSNIIIRRSSFNHATGNGLAVVNFNQLYIFDSYSEDCGVDAFNYHASAIKSNPIEKVFLYNCYAFNMGYNANNNGNAFTGHDGMKIIGVNLIGHDTVGPVLADVNGSDSLYYDCVMYNSKANVGATKSAFWSDEALALKTGSMKLINCSGGGDNTHSINTDGKVVPVLQNFNGDIPISLTVEIVK